MVLEDKVLQCKRIARWGLLLLGAVEQQAPVAAMAVLVQHLEIAAAAVLQALQPQPVPAVLAHFLVVAVAAVAEV